VCDILLCYLPLSYPCGQLDEEYILQIMSFEYGSVIELANEAQNLDAVRRIEWPAPVSKEVILGCLHRYYEGTKWTDPPICAVCSQ
ncbi:hypothetical protein P692DRAFT_20639125, partial [Suillus brevipes Sb2]